MEEFLKKHLLIGLVSVVMTSSMLLAQQPAPTTTPQPAATPQAPATPPSKAKIATDMTDFEFGWIPSDSYVSHTYWFYSRGEDSLRIISVNPG